MPVYRFEDLRVWQAAKRQCDRVGKLMKRPDFVSDRKLTDQMNDASISVANNISEGFLRATELFEENAAISKMLRRWMATLAVLKASTPPAR